MKRMLCLLALLSMLCGTEGLAQIYTYTNATNGAPSFTAANTTYSNLTAIGTGGNTPCGQGFSGITGFTNGSYNPNGPVVSVLVRPNACYQLNITGFQAGLRRSGTGPVNARLVYSVDGGATWVLCPTVFSPLNAGCATSAGGTTNANWTTSVTVTSSTLGVIFRVCPYGASGSGGTLQIWGLNIYGTVTPCAPTLTPNVTNVSCNGGTNGAVNLGVVGGCNPFTYAWTGPNSFTANTQNISNVPAGTYTVNVTSPGGCGATTTATITQPNPINVTVVNNGPLCTGATLQLQASPITNATYVWSGPNSFSANTQNATLNYITMAGAGIYTLTATVAGCNGVNTTNVVVNPSPTPVIGTIVNPTTCGGTDGSITLTGLAPISVFTIAYTKDGNPQSGTVASDINGVVTINNLAAGLYDNIILTLGPCSSTALGPITLTDPPVPATPVANSNSPVCSGDPINLSTTAVTNATYSWTGPNTFLSAVQNPTIAPSILAHAGTYSVTVTVANCVSLPGTVNVVVKPTPVILGTLSTNPTTCGGNNGTISLTGLIANTSFSVNYNFNAVPQATQTLTSDNSGVMTINALVAGTYDNISVTLNGCQSNVMPAVVITDPAPPVITGTTPTNPTICAGNDGTISLDGLTANTAYTVDYDLNGISQATVTIASNGSGVVTITGLSSGVYDNITVTLNNCISASVGPVTLTDPVAPVITGSSSTDPTTCLGADGTITLTGLLPNTTYALDHSFNSVAQAAITVTSNGGGSIIINGLVAGEYSNIKVTLNNCVSNIVGPVTLADPAIPVVLAGTNAPVCEGNTVNLTATTINNAQYSWSGPAGFTNNTQNPSITNAQISHSGQYIVTAIAYNCTSEPDTVDVLVAPMPTLPVISNNGPLCAGNDLHLTANTIAGATYNWTGPNTFTSNDEDPIIIAADETASGTYTVTAQIGTCISGAATTTVVVDPGTAAPIAGNVTYCQDESAIPLTATGQSLLWYTLPSGGTGTAIAPIPSTATAGTFSWYVSQTQNNCESPRTQVDVLVNPTPAMPIADSVLGYCQGVPAITLSATGQNILWYNTLTGGTGNSAPPTPQTGVPGIFKYYVTQTVNDCESDRKEITVTVNTKPNVPGVQTVEYCTGETAVVLTANGSNILWYGNGGTTGDPVAPTPSTTVPDSLVWLVTQTVSGCESDQTPLTVLVHQQPTVDLSVSDNEICQYETVVFTSMIATGPLTQYEWVIPSSAEIVNGADAGTAAVRFDVAGTFNVVLKLDNRGCTAEDAVAITVKDAPVATVSLPEHACVGDEVTIGIGSASDGINSYSWNFDGATVVEDRGFAGPFKVRWTHPGTYTVKLTVSDNVCTSDRNEDTIQVHYLPDAGIKPMKEGVVCAGDSVKVEAFTKEDTWEYTWGPAVFFEYGNFNHIQYPMVKRTGFINLTVKTEYGCISTDSMYVETQPCCNVYFPTAFSPNFDGRNDHFRPITDGNHDLATFVIKNRWGQTVFETISNNEMWDGTLSGKPLDIGVYYYYYKYKCEGKMQELKGEVTLIR